MGAPADRFVISTNPCLIIPCPLPPPPPTTTASGATFGVYVAAQFGTGGTDPGFVGTVTFSSSDPLATLPSTYTFVTGDHGGNAFGAILRTQGVQSVFASDMSGILLPGNLQMTVNAAAQPQAVRGLANPGKLVLLVSLLLAALWIIRKTT
jgi:hypothetical protein